MSDDCFCIWMLGSWTGRFKAGALRTVVLKDWQIVQRQVSVSWAHEFLTQFLRSNFILNGWFMIACPRGWLILGFVILDVGNQPNFILARLAGFIGWLWNCMMQSQTRCFEAGAHLQPQWCVYVCVWTCILHSRSYHFEGEGEDFDLHSDDGTTSQTSISFSINHNTNQSVTWLQVPRSVGKPVCYSSCLSQTSLITLMGFWLGSKSLALLHRIECKWNPYHASPGFAIWTC